jgi:hypothetical protein
MPEQVRDFMANNALAEKDILISTVLTFHRRVCYVGASSVTGLFGPG